MSLAHAWTAGRSSGAAFTWRVRVQRERPLPTGSNRSSSRVTVRRGPVGSAAHDVRGSVLLGHDSRRMRSAGFFVCALRALLALVMSAGVVVPSANRSLASERAWRSSRHDRGAELAAVCASCHRLDGRDHGIPSIIGLDEATLVAEMRAFKSGERPGQIMRVISLSLTAEDFAAVARYLAAQRKDTTPR